MRGPDAAELRRNPRLCDVGYLVRALGLDEGARREGRGWKSAALRTGSAPAPARSPKARTGPPACAASAATSPGTSSTWWPRREASIAGATSPRVVELVAELAGEHVQGPTRREPAAPPPLEDDVFDRLVQEMQLCPIARMPEGARYLDGRGILGEVGADWRALPVDALAELQDTLVRGIGMDAWQRSGLAHITAIPAALTAARAGPGRRIAW